MIRFTPIALAFLSLAAAPLPPAAPETAGPEATIAQFYETVIRMPGGGVPDAKQLDRLRPFVTAELAAALAKADKAEAHYAERTKNEVPPLVEGDLFSSLFEGATALESVHCAPGGRTARCRVQLRSDDPQGKDDPVRWTDQLMLTNNQGWRVDNIYYGASWEFGNKGTLREILGDVVRDADRPLD